MQREKYNLIESLKKQEMVLEIQEDQKAEPPIDYEYEFGLTAKPRTDSPKLSLPTQKENLFVLKPIDRYEPTHIKSSQGFHPDPNSKLKRKYPSEPKTHAEIRDCEIELNGELI